MARQWLQGEERTMSAVELHANIDRTYARLIEASENMSLVETFTAPRPSIVERLAAGKALREKVPRRTHAAHDRSASRPDPVAILEQQNATRVQKLVPVRYARMLASPFAFLRGSAAVMADDLSRTPVSGVSVAACGDMHVSNFGLFASAERNLVFAINDFDEVHPGPWEWDLKRLAASAAVAVRFMGGRDTAAEEAARQVVSAYRRWIRRYAGMGCLEVWYTRIDESSILASVSPEHRRNTERIFNSARAKGHIQALEKLTERVDGEHRLIEDVPLIVRETHTDSGTPISVALGTLLRAYLNSLSYDRRRLLARYQIVDVARKVVGVGSVGTACWVILLRGVDDDDPLFLQVKEAKASVLAPYVDSRLPFENEGRRVVVGQYLTQGSPDIFLGWGQADPGYFYVRQLADMKGGLKFGEGDRQALKRFSGYCRLCGVALALAHAKSGDPAMIAGYCGKSEALDEAIGRFALAYLGQTERDFEALDAARRSGRIQTASDDTLK
jgi:uncharacterized protein (DUF2252 family)